MLFYDYGQPPTRSVVWIMCFITILESEFFAKSSHCCSVSIVEPTGAGQECSRSSEFLRSELAVAVGSAVYLIVAKPGGRQGEAIVCNC